MVSGCGNRNQSQNDPQTPPNFIIVLTDDLGYNDLGCYWTPGSDRAPKKLRTKNIDRMAKQGMRFTSFYVNAPVCTPTRASLLTGCYAVRVDMAQTDFGVGRVLGPTSKKGLNPDEVTLAEILKDRGYATACIGKWHLGSRPEFYPTRQGFEYYYGVMFRDPDGNAMTRGEKVVEHVAHEDLIAAYTEETIDFIVRNKDRPFFVYLAHGMPHPPLAVSDEFRRKSPRGLYGDVVMCLDWSMGEILKALKKQRLDKRTFVMFASDNGPDLSIRHSGDSYPLRGGKGEYFEGGVRVPCIVRWPGRIPRKSVSSEMVTTMDILPTFALLADAEIQGDRTIDGRDVRPILSGDDGARSPHEAFFYYHKERLVAVRSGKWKLMFERNSEVHIATLKERNARIKLGPEALYDLENDISESKNVLEQNPAVVERLMALARTMRADLGDENTGWPAANQRPAGWVLDEGGSPPND
jgi:arylsulfatase